jgi:hypothetical protein
MAQNWVESLFTESLIVLLVIFDISLTVVEAELAKAGKTEVCNTLFTLTHQSTGTAASLRTPTHPAHPPPAGGGWAGWVNPKQICSICTRFVLDLYSICTLFVLNFYSICTRDLQVA